MTILFLYSEVMGYTLSTIRSLINDHGCIVYLVYWDTKKKTPFQLEEISGLHTRARSTFSSKRELSQWADQLNPDLLYVSGRMDYFYLQTALFFRRKNVPVVSGMDNQWQNTWRQRIAIFFSDLLYRKYFDYIWVAGPLQFAYASRLGYSPDRILQNLYSADTDLFLAKERNEKFSGKRTLLFVGRLDLVKGIGQAIDAFLKVKSSSKYDWKLKVIGSGPLEGTLPKNVDVEYIPFINPSELATHTENASAFILPSIHEPWGVVVHEMAAAGLPLFCSDKVGANTTFLIQGYNGFIFESGNSKMLEDKLSRLLDLSDDELKLMAKRSCQLSFRINPTLSASSLLSVLRH